VGSVDLGGKTPDEAERIVRQRATRVLEGIELNGPEQMTLSPGRMGAHYDIEATVDAAYAVGREGSIARRLSDRLHAASGTLAIPPAVEYRTGKVRAQVQDIASRWQEEPRAALINVHGREIEVVSAREGYELDVNATAQSVNRAIEDMGGEAEIVGEVLRPRYTTAEAEHAAEKARAAAGAPITLTYDGQRWSISPAEIRAALEVTAQDGGFRVGLNRNRMGDYLAGVHDQLTVEPEEADFTIEGSAVSVTPGEAGRRVQEEELLDALRKGVFQGRRTYEVSVVESRPELTTAEAKRLKPTELVGRYRTRYVGTGDESQARVENLRIASRAINGTTLAPGEVFSANDILAPLEYNDANVIIDGKVESALGGGLCQIASTVYMATNYAGLDVIERHPHYSELSYIRPGLDSTLWFGAANGYSGQELDMRFRNTSDGYVMVREYVADDGYLYAEVWGRPTGKKVEMDSRRISASKRQTGWVTHQTVKKNGEVLFDGVLHKDTYEPLISEEGEPIPNTEPAPVNP
ncbi:MAG: peptidoglycan binding domain-containing protein, partial [Actinobacteria bacterium]|nr:peptidoglycan binding domain-containing protein [Actinomycetota bacterium]